MTIVYLIPICVKVNFFPLSFEIGTERGGDEKDC